MTGLTVLRPDGCYSFMGDAYVAFDRIDVDEPSQSCRLLLGEPLQRGDDGRQVTHAREVVLGVVRHP